MSTRAFIGVDPGPTPGIVRLSYVDGRLTGCDAIQCTPGIIEAVLDLLICNTTGVLVQLERFVDSMRTGKSRNRTDLDTTRAVYALAAGRCRGRRIPLAERRAGDVKPWATDDRLAAAGLLEPTRAMPHARDAARHALYLACDSGMPDPLSSRSRT